MEVNSTARYFFPANVNRLKATVWSPLMTMHRREMSERLAISRRDTSKRYDSRVSGTIRKTIRSERLRTHSRNISERICKTIESQRLKMNSPQLMAKRDESKFVANRGATESIGLKNLLQKAMCLQLQQANLSGNPFFKIQKKRNSQKWRHCFALNLNRQQLQQSQQQQPKQQLFHNRSLVSVNDDYSPKLRAKSETVTYYQIKDYYENKYGREPTPPL